MRHLALLFTGLLLALACAGPRADVTDQTADAARPEVRYYVIADT